MCYIFSPWCRTAARSKILSSCDLACRRPSPTQQGLAEAVRASRDMMFALRSPHLQPKASKPSPLQLSSRSPFAGAGPVTRQAASARTWTALRRAGRRQGNPATVSATWAWGKYVEGTAWTDRKLYTNTHPTAFQDSPNTTEWGSHDCGTLRTCRDATRLLRAKTCPQLC